MTDRELMADAVEIMLSAINSGDWKVDGACDPHASIIRLKNRLGKPEYEFECPRCGHCCQQREWIGLTDDDFKKFKSDEFVVFAKDIEALLKERNN